MAGGAAGIAVGMGWGAYSVRNEASGIRGPLLYAFGPYTFASQLQILSGQVSRPGLFNRDQIQAQHPSRSGEPLINREAHVTQLTDHNSRSVTTPNTDTLYTSAVLDLAAGPVQVTVPKSVDRYLSVAFMDLFTDQIAYAGSRTTGRNGGTFWIIGPGQTPSLPDGVTAIHSTSNDLWMLARIFVSGESDFDAALEVQAEIKVKPVDPANQGTPFKTKAPENPDAETFLALTNEILGRSPLSPQTRRAAEFAEFGIVPGALDTYADLSSIRRFVWSQALSRVETQIYKQLGKHQSSTAGWLAPPAILGNYGTNDELRAGIALVGFGALTLDEAVYFRALTDVEGDVLSGQESYQMIIPPTGVPADAFWSLSMYESDGNHRSFFYANEINRYAINSGSEDLAFQADGSIVLALQSNRPSDPTHVWMPTPDGPFETVFRVYAPQTEVTDQQWSPPPITEAGTSSGPGS